MINIDSETLYSYEDLLKKALPEGKKDWDEQVETAVAEFENKNADYLASMTDADKQMLATYYALAFIFRYLSTSPDDVFEVKRKLYAEEYEKAYNRVIGKGLDLDGDGEADTSYTIDMER